MVEPIKLGSTLDIARIAMRERLVREYAWAIPNDAALEAVSAHGPIVEIGAGNGYWAHELRARSVDVIAYDPHPYQEGEYADLGALGRVDRRDWGEVLEGDQTAAADHPDRSLMICWPSYDLPWAGEALALYAGDTVIYVGEGGGGCTGDDSFHDLLYSGFKVETRVDIPNYFGIRDDLAVWRRQ